MLNSYKASYDNINIKNIFTVYKCGIYGKDM